DAQDVATATNSGYGKPLRTIPTPSENPSTCSLGSYKTALTIPSQNQSTTHVAPPPMSRKGGSGQIPTIPSAARNTTSTFIQTIPGPHSHHHPPEAGPPAALNLLNLLT
ncbi:hypothetical protein FRC01_008063, partial [Tulasnella sp. 417]